VIVCLGLRALAFPSMGPDGNGTSTTHDDKEEFMPTDEDLLYEEELLRNPYNLKMWLRYLDARKDASPKKRYLLYERGLRALPGSYKVGSHANLHLL
jgi:hypothetical protein